MKSDFSLQDTLAHLSISELEAAQLLSVDPRTVRRWSSKADEIPGPAKQALLAWQRLESLGLAWRPDGIAFGEDDTDAIAKQITAYRNHAIDLGALLEKVKQRGGPAAPWIVDLPKRTATLGPIRITFYALQNGGFSPQGYTRRDISPDRIRDAHLIEEGFAAVAAEIAKAGRDWAKRNEQTREQKSSPAARKKK